jgi:hypothetical protein
MSLKVGTWWQQQQQRQTTQLSMQRDRVLMTDMKQLLWLRDSDSIAVAQDQPQCTN